MLIQEESLSRKFITKGAWIYIFVLLTAPLGYALRIILTWDLTPSEIGIIYGTISLLWLLGTYTDFGLTESLNYFLPKYIIKNDYARSKYLLLLALSIQLLTSTIVSIWLYFWAGFLADHFFHSSQATWVIEIFSLFFIGNHVLTVITTFFSAIQNIKLQKIVDTFRLIVSVSWAGILLFSHTWNILLYSWIWIIGTYSGLLMWICIFYYSYYRIYFELPAHYDHALRKSLIQYSLGTLFSANVATVLHQIDMQFLTYFIGVYDTGIYSIYLSLVGIPFIFLGPLIGFLFPVISEIGGRWDHRKIQTIYAVFTTYLSVIVCWVWAIFILCGKEIAWFLFGNDFLASWVALYYIAPFLVFNIFFQIHFQILWWLGFVKKRIEILIYTLILSVIVSLVCILGYKYGYIPFPSGSSAVSFAVGVSWILLWYLSYRAIREYAIGFDWQFFLKNISIVIVFMVSYHIIQIHYDLAFWLIGRLQYLPWILFALWSSLIIFLLINTTQFYDFITIVKKVRNWSL